MDKTACGEYSDCRMQEPPSISANQPYATNDSYTVSGKPSDGWKGVLSTVLILLAAPAVALLLTAFIFQSYEVDGPSMESSLQNRDRLIVWKAPRTLSRITNHPYIPKRGDVIVFVKHGVFEQSGKQEKQLIKRVVGLPGDRVVVADGRITIFNKEHPEGYNPDSGHEFSQYIGALTTGNVDLVVPEGEVFACGDNRTNSLDSRSFGTIPSKDIVGKLTVRIFPINSFKSFI